MQQSFDVVMLSKKALCLKKKSQMWERDHIRVHQPAREERNVKNGWDKGIMRTYKKHRKKQKQQLFQKILRKDKR